MAKSRRPPVVSRSQLSNSAATASGPNARGREPPPKPAGVGTTEAS